MDRKPRKFNPHKIKQQYCTIFCYITIVNNNIPYNWPTSSQQVNVLSSICTIYLEYVTKDHIVMHTIMF